MIAFFPSREIFVTLGPVLVHWYGIMYAIAFILGIWMFPKLLKMADITVSAKDRETFVLWVFLGVLLGGRLGFVVLYGGTYFVENPTKIIAVWEGGMSSHGGFIGVFLALCIFAYRKHVDLFRLADVLVIPAAIGLALGRIGNLINGELYGTLTTLPWGMSFPTAEGIRHPTQLYAFFKDTLIASVCYLHLSSYAHTTIKSGRTAGYFLMLYGILRFIVEIFRDQPYGYVDILGMDFSRGQLFTIPVFIAGAIILLLRRKSLQRT